ncbi:TPA: resolvase [Candidatus Gastranaerophilales bacterium HUM_5]|nr:MAG TPA: resolvase [Candidatus Gastranaerophilales bacterium HUM_4]DAA92951.1 MAG TPA: resolvase [Candidatus Gastranaerophilales bacterium HUM_5]
MTTKGFNFAYIRVSTEEQNYESQMEAMKDLEFSKVFTEKRSAKDSNRPELQNMLDYVREGDTVYVKDFSRLARSTKDLLNIIDILETKKVKLVSIKEKLDTSTPAGKLMVTMLGAIYEFERANLLERQKDGIAVAKKEGKYKGRKKIQKPDNWQEVYSDWACRKITAKKACELLKLKTNTFYNFVKAEREVA